MRLLPSYIRSRIDLVRQTVASLRERRRTEPWRMPALPPDGMREMPRRRWWWIDWAWRWWWEEDPHVEPTASPVPAPASPPPPRPRPPRVGRRLFFGVGSNVFLSARDPEREDPSAALRGCGNDIHNWGVALDGLGWTLLPALLNQKALAKVAMERYGNIVADLRANDRLVTVWSMHGSHADDLREPDGLVECYCPYDALVDWPTNLITARAFASIHRGIPDGARVIQIADLCHAAPKDLDILARGLFGTGRDRRSKYLEPPVPPIGKKRPRSLLGRPPDIIAPWRQDVLLAAAESDEVAADTFEDGGHCGAWSWSLLRVLKGNPSATLTELREGAARLLAANRYQQTPKLLGKPENFGLTLDS